MKYNVFKKMIAFVLLFAVSTISWAYDFEADGICYNIDGSNVTVTSGTDAYSGDVVIPASVTYESTTYTVTTIGESAFEDCEGLTSVTLPESITTIDKYAFWGCEGLTSITIPANVPSIGESAFHLCSNLTKVTIESNSIVSRDYTYTNNIKNVFGTQVKEYVIGDGVTSIGNSAFDSCSSLISITIPNSVTNIGWDAFFGCSGLTSITIPESVTSIGAQAFRYCSGLTSITIPNSVTSIGSKTFYDCSGLTSISIPNSVTSIGSEAFYNCSGLTSISIPNSVTSIGSEAFYNCSSLTSISIPNSVTSIGQSAFSGCSGLNRAEFASIESLCNISFSPGGNSNPLSYAHHLYVDGQEVTNLVIPESVASIRNYTFYGCSGLTSVTIPNSVTSIGREAFCNCSGLTSVTIPKKITSISYGAFNGCSGLTSVIIPKGVTSIEQNAFSGCSGLNRAEFASIESLCNISFESGSNPLSYAHHLYVDGQEVTNLVIPEGVTSIRNYTFSGCSGLTSVTIPESVTSIGQKVFSNCSSLTSVTIPNSVTSIGEWAFYNCSGLTSIIIPNNVTSISNDAFYGCSNLTSVIIGNSVTSIGDGAFHGCSGLTSVTIPESVTNIGEDAFMGCTGLTSIAIPDGVISIGEWAFYNCSGLMSASIGSGVTGIGKDAFYECSSLICVTCEAVNVPTTGADAFYRVPQSSATLYVPESSIDAYKAAYPWNNFGTILSVEDKEAGVWAMGKCGESVNYVLSDDLTLTISGSGAMANYNNFSNVPWKNYSNAIKCVVIEDGVTSIGGSAFFGCSGLTSVTIGGSVTSINWSAFEDCTALTSIIVASGNTKYDSRNNCNAIIETASNTLMLGCKNTIIPNSVISIDEAAFWNCSGLTSITIPNSVTSIGIWAFYGCSGLTSVTIPNSVTSIGDGAFECCSSLTSITIPESVTSIGQQAFDGCSGLTSITIPNSVTSIGDCAFADCSSLTSFTIPESVTSIYGNTFFGCSGLTSITIPNSVTSIRYGAFASCFGLTSITIPNSVTSIENDAFADCSSLTSVTCLAENVPTMSSNVFQNVPQSTATLYVPESSLNAYKAANQWKDFGTIKAIGGEPFIFADANVKAICVSNWDTNGDGELDEDEAAAVTSLGEVFKNNTTITSFDELQYFTGLTSIGNSAFEGCSCLTSITIPNSVTSIGDFAFDGCLGLTSITIPNSVTSIGGNRAMDPAYLESIIVEDGNPVYDSRNGCNAIIETATNKLVFGCKNTVIPNSIKIIGSHAFCGCTFSSIDIPEGVEIIEFRAFWNCGAVSSILIPSSVESIEGQAFFGCDNVGTIIVQEGNSVLDSRDNCNAIIETATNTLFRGCKNTVIPESVTNIGYGAFYGCAGLTSITIPNSVTSIGDLAFKACYEDLISVTIPGSVTSIGSEAFRHCHGLTSITIPGSVTSIGESAFNDCTGLISVISEIEEPFAFGNEAFSGISSECVLTVPASKKEAYIAQGWTTNVFQGGIIDAVASANHLTLTDASGLVGAQCVLPISMFNTESIKGLQFDLRLPEGVTVATNEYDELMFTLTSRAHSSHTVSATRLSNGDYRVVVSSLSAKTFKDTEGVIMNVTLSVDKNMAAGDYEVNLFSIVLNTADNVSIMPNDVTATLTLSDVAPGDVNGDGNVNVTDVGMVIDHILEHTPSGFIAEAADVNGDGDINVTDVGLIIDIILSDNNAREALREDAEEKIEEIIEPQ